ncbi:copper chaperone PCu(A)C [Methylosinus sp. Sm6]|uniref:copper chaperone PCu(A)C n=1 Tax=Methylosinus sp. Sm6 TaxID=2866948 RepID=UPI001C99FC8D|nr:copper chaperone PCu(A)C [Methylosinus sp. Sm6]MBY6243114.1 copper chaperone PCu(A)C [Methylosinus sp. Sm6]
MTIDRRRILSRALSAGAAFAACFIIWPSTSIRAHEYEVGAIKIEHPWLRAPHEGETRAQLYMFVSNKGDRPDRLIGVKSAGFGSAEFHVAPHFAVRENAIYLPPMSKVTLEPGGSHVLLVDISKMNPIGWGFEMTLVFDKAGEVAIDASIDAPDAMHAHDADAMERWRKSHRESSSEPETPSDHTDHDQMQKDQEPIGGEGESAPKSE